MWAIMMFSPLARGTGSWACKFDPNINSGKYKVTLPEIDPGPSRHAVGPIKSQTHTVAAFSKTDAQIELPKTYITRKGALLLFTAPETEAQSERNNFRQKLYSKLSKEANSKDFGQTLGTLERLSLSILQFGDEGFVRENSSISDRDSKFFLHFLHTEDVGDLDTRSQPGGDLPSYLRDLRYRASSHLLGIGDTYMPKNREAQELRAILHGLDRNWPPPYTQNKSERSAIADQFTRPVSCTSARSGSPVSATSGSVRQVLSCDKLVASLKSSYSPTPPVSNDEDLQGGRTPHSGRLLYRRHSAQTKMGTSIKEEGENEGEKRKGKGKNAYWPVTGTMDNILGVVDHSKDKNAISVAVMGKCEQLHEVQADRLQNEHKSIVTINKEVAESTKSLDYHPEGYQEEVSNFRDTTKLPDKNNISLVSEPLFIEYESDLELVSPIQVEVHIRENIHKTIDKIDVGCETKELRDDEGHSTPSDSKNVKFYETFSDSEFDTKLAVTKGIKKATKKILVSVKNEVESKEDSELNNISESDETQTNNNSKIGFCSKISQNADAETFVTTESRLEIDTAHDYIAHEEVAGGNRPGGLNEVCRLEKDLTSLSIEKEDNSGVSHAESLAATEESDAVQDLQKPQSVIEEDEREEMDFVIQPLMPEYADAPESAIGAPHISGSSTHSSASITKSHVLPAVGASTMKPGSIREVSREDFVQRDPTTLVSEHLNVDCPVDTESELQNLEETGGSTVQADDVTSTMDQEANEHIETSKSSKRSIKSTKPANGARVKFPDYLSDAMKRTPSMSKREMDKGLERMSEIAISTLSSFVVDTDGKEGLTEEELLVAREILKQRMSEAKEKMDAFERSRTKKRKEDSKCAKKAKKEIAMKKDLSKEKELRKFEKQRKIEEVIALQQKIAEKAATRKAQEDEVLQKSRELEEEMARIQLEADEIKKAEEDARQQLAESRQIQREEREARRRDTLEKKKQDALERREKEKKLLEKSRKKEQEMLDRIADSEMRRRLKEDEDRKKEEEERLAQEKIEEELHAAKKTAEEDEERMRELEREAEEEAMQILIDGQNEAKRRRRELEEERRQMKAVEERKRQILLAEEMKLKEKQRRKEEENEKRMEEERRRLKELERLEHEARDHIRREVEMRRQSAMKRRDKNLEAKANLNKVRHGQGITRPWVFSYFVKWPRESYERPFSSDSEEKNTKKGVKEKGNKVGLVSEAGTTLDADTSVATTNS